MPSGRARGSAHVAGTISSPVAVRGPVRRTGSAGRQPTCRSLGALNPDGLGMARREQCSVVRMRSATHLPLGCDALIELERGPGGIGPAGALRFGLWLAGSPAAWPAPRARGRPRRQVQPGEDPLCDVRIRDGGEHSHASAAARAAQDIHPEDALQGGRPQGAPGGPLRRCRGAAGVRVGSARTCRVSIHMGVGAERRSAPHRAFGCCVAARRRFVRVEPAIHSLGQHGGRSARASSATDRDQAQPPAPHAASVNPCDSQEESA